MNPFQSLRDYEAFIYALPEQFPSILHSMLVVVQRGRSYAELYHKHLLPDIKHHRILAPGLSCTAPNLPFLIGEIETTLLQT
jgi:hypothetical protein